MVDITDKKNTLRFASAEAIIIVSNKETIRAIQKKIVPKGDVFEVSRAAGLLGVKKHLNFYLTAIHYQLNLPILNLK